MSLGQVLIFSKDPALLQSLCRHIFQLGFDCIPQSRCQGLEKYLLYAEDRVSAIIIDRPAALKNAWETLFSFREVFQREQIPLFILDQGDAIQPFLNEIGMDRVYIVSCPQQGDVEEFLVEFLKRVPVRLESSREKATYFRVLEGDLSEYPFDRLKTYLQEKQFDGIVFLQTPQMITLLLQWRRGGIDGWVPNRRDVADIGEYLSTLKEGRFIVEQRLLSKRDFHAWLFNQENSHVLSMKDVLSDLFYFVYHIFEEKLDSATVRQIFASKFSEYKELFPALKDLTFHGDVQDIFGYTGDLQSEQVEYLLMLFNDLLNELLSRLTDYHFEDFIRDIDEISPYLKQFQLMEKILLMNKQPFSLA